MQFTNIYKHFCKITRHKWFVFKLSIKAGIPWRGLVHDLSKYSWTEFSEGVKFYQGNRSPIPKAKEINGYSEAWLHHKGLNKHHHQYWYDADCKDIGVMVQNHSIMMPFKYVLELICDNYAAGMNYRGKEWEKGFQLEYFRTKESKLIHNQPLRGILEEVYSEVAEKGIDKVLKKKHIKEIYDKYVKE